MELSQVVPCAGGARAFSDPRGIFRSVFLAAGLVCLLLHPVSLPAQQFQTAITTITNVNSHVVAGDFNHDGFVDVATAGEAKGDSFVSVLLSNGDGTFTLGSSYETADDNAIGVADLNGDGNLDLLITDGDGNVGVMLGNGDGTFKDRVEYHAGKFPDCVGVGDFNHDGKLDVAVCDGASNTVAILLGNGDGTLGAPTAFPVGAFPIAISVADFNNDSNLDLVVANQNDNTVSVLLGQGNGTFQSSKTYNVGATPSSVTTADFNNDGNTDFAVASTGTYVFLGNGDGTFGAAKTYAAVGGTAIVAADLNGDGKADLVTGGFSVLWGNGDGTFKISDYAVPFVADIAVGDFNGDGRLDVLGADYGDLDVQVLLQNRDATFEAPRSFQTSAKESATAVGDFNGDGNQDVAAVSSGQGLAIFLGNGRGELTRFAHYDVGYFGSSIITADFNGDGKLDLAVIAGNSEKQNGAVLILLGNGDGTFQQPVPYNYFNASWPMVVGDFNGDGKLDIAVGVDNTPITSRTLIGILLGNGDGTFRAGSQIPLGDNPGGFATADFNGDGILDLAVPQSASVNIYLGNGDGTFRAGQVYPEDETPVSIAVGDFNRDGRTDFVVLDGLYGTFFVFLGNGDGTFIESAPYDNGGYDSRKIVVGDLNGDGKQDLVVASVCNSYCHLTPGAMSFIPGNGDGTFQPPVYYYVAFEPTFVTLGDFNNDGADDLLGSPYLSVSLNLGGTYIQLGSSPNPSKHGQPVTFAAKVTRSVQAVTKPAGPTGTVTFYDGNAALGTVPLNSGVAKFTTSGLSVGTHSIHALYSGDGNYNRHLSDVYKQQVTQ